MAYIRAYGDFAGDPVPQQHKRPSHTAARGHAPVTHTRSKKAQHTKRVQGSSAGSIIMGNLKGALAGLPGAATSIFHGQLPPGIGTIPRFGRGGGGGGRRINPANAHALRRALSRVDRFYGLVKSVNKRFRKTETKAGRHQNVRYAAAPSHARGHRAGCRCAICKRRS